MVGQLTPDQTCANAGQAVLRSTPISPKMKRRNGRTERLTDQLTDGLTHLEVLISTVSPVLAAVMD